MSDKVVIFSFNCEPVSINKLYVSCRGAKRFISKEGKAFKSAVETGVAKQLTKTMAKNISELVGKPLTVNVVVGLPTWLLKNGKSVRKKDIDNTFKALNDSVFTTLQEKVDIKLDDSYVWQVTLTKKVTSKVEVTFQISEYTDTI